jgi:soluble lytic murein transglycosylase
VAERIDALPEALRTDPGTRYVRAVAAVQLGDCEPALRVLTGLAQRLPLLKEEIARFTAKCQLEIGPFAAAAAYYEREGSVEGRLEAALAWHREGEFDRARALVEEVLKRSRLSRTMRVRAMTLSAKIAERQGQLDRARDDYRWLATRAAVPGTDESYERLAHSFLTKRDRLQRAKVFARRGEIRLVLSELEKAKGAPGAALPPALVLRTKARGYYRSRTNDAKAAKLYERTARRSGSVEDLFSAARAWSRAGAFARARSLYTRIEKHQRSTAIRARAAYALAHSLYTRGRWSAAARTYERYLRRYGRRRAARFVDAVVYERSVSQLAAGDFAAARKGFRRLARKGSTKYPPVLLQHLEAIALVSSKSSQERRKGIAGLREIMRRYPLSFAALASAARLERMGEHVPPLLGALPRSSASTSMEAALPANVQLLAKLGLYSAAERTLHRQEHVLRSTHAPRAEETLCRLYGSLGGGWSRYSIGSPLAKHGMLRVAPTVDNLWAWRCTFPNPYEEAVRSLEKRYRIPAGLTHAVIRQESAFRFDARSPAGAVGLMQLMPATAARAAAELAMEHLPERLTEVGYNLELGTFYLGKLLAALDQRPSLALAAYNAGPQAVSRWLEGGRDLPLDVWVARIPYAETRHYVMRVIGNWASYRYLKSGLARLPQLNLEIPTTLDVPSNAY